MKFSVNRSLFNEQLSEIMRVVPNRSTMPILGNILFNLDGNQLKLRASDIEVSMETIIDVKGKEDGEVAIPANFIQIWLFPWRELDHFGPALAQIQTAGGFFSQE